MLPVLPNPASHCCAGLPRSMWAAAVPANYDRALGALVEDIYGDHQLMVMPWLSCRCVNLNIGSGLILLYDTLSYMSVVCTAVRKLTTHILDGSVRSHASVRQEWAMACQQLVSCQHCSRNPCL